MNIEKLSMEFLNIPFRQSFSHASASRNVTETVIVKAVSENGLIGYGEGCPRSYVTGETIRSAVRCFEQIKGEISNFQNTDHLKLWVKNNADLIDKNPAAWCALELALLDLLGKENQATVESLLSLSELSGTFFYTAVLGAEGLEEFEKQLEQYAHVGFEEYKIKMSGDLEEDRKKVNLLRELGGRTKVRLDANNLWDSTKKFIGYVKALDYPFFALEEPTKQNDYIGFLAICKSLETPIILDESFLNVDQFSHTSSDPNAWIINLRISKMGGIIRSLGIAEKATALGIPIIIGAQVGETSILTRAALTVANTHRNILVAQEGAFGTHLLEKDIAELPIMFGKGGKLDVSRFTNQFGFGVNCNL